MTEKIDEIDDDVFDHLLERNKMLLENILTVVESHPDSHYQVGCEAVEGIEVHVFNEDGPESGDLDRMWVNAPGATFFAQRCMWTDDPEPAPTQDSWLVTAVIPGKPSIFFAKHLDDDLWSPFPASKAPWFVVSTASAMRAAQQGTHVPALRQANDNPDLFKTPDQAPLPPVDTDGTVG